MYECVCSLCGSGGGDGLRAEAGLTACPSRPRTPAKPERRCALMLHTGSKFRVSRLLRPAILSPTTVSTDVTKIRRLTAPISHGNPDRVGGSRNKVVDRPFLALESPLQQLKQGVKIRSEEISWSVKSNTRCLERVH